MDQPHISVDVSPASQSSEMIEDILKNYCRVWMNESTKDLFIRKEKRDVFNRIVFWSIDCRSLDSEILFAFHHLEEQIKQGISDTKAQGLVKWSTQVDSRMQFYCNDIAYREGSLWDKLGQILNVYFLNHSLAK